MKKEEKIWCDRCCAYTMIEKGSIYWCPICDNWHYNSSRFIFLTPTI